MQDLSPDERAIVNAIRQLKKGRTFGEVEFSVTLRDGKPEMLHTTVKSQEKLSI